LIAEQRKLDVITPGSIAEFIAGAFSPDRIVIAGANIAHDELVGLAEASLGGLDSSFSAVTVPSLYTGGSVRISGSGPGHFAIGFEGVSWADDDLVPICVLHTLLGGGGSFSSGGPGKGMYTRLFSEILNRREWVSSAVAFNHCYSDSGLFGIHSSCQDPANLNNLIEVVTEQVGKIGDALGQGELERAKNMTKSGLIMNLESRAVVCEDVGRQILGSNKYVGPDELVKAIEAVDEDAIRRVARRILASKPSIVMHGEEYATHAFEKIESSVKAQAKIAV
jgi:mitochondrial-processing peptidase subunit alpha